MKLRLARLSSLAALIGLTLLTATTVRAQTIAPLAPTHDALTLDASVATEVIPDLAVITLAAEAQGVDAAPPHP
jgi:predicted secreted protein